MKINFLLTILLCITSIVSACDDDSSKEENVSEAGEALSAGQEDQSSAGEMAGDDDSSMAGMPVQVLDFDTMEIEPESDMSFDLDLD